MAKSLFVGATPLTKTNRGSWPYRLIDSCAASYCTCSPKVSCASVTSGSWPTGDVPPSCRFAFNCSARHKNREPNKTFHPPVTHMTCGAALSVVDRWWSSRGSPLPRSNFALHRCSLLPHETTLSSPNPSRLSACPVSLRLNAEQNSIPSFLSAASTTLSRGSQLPASFAVLSRTALPTLDTAVFPHSISIGPASAATTGGLLLTP